MEVIAENAASASPSSTEVSIVTDGGRRLTSKVVLAADGRDSILRAAAGIKTNSWSYEQVAVATSFSHSGPHDGISTEYHKAQAPSPRFPCRPRFEPRLDGAAGARCSDHGPAGRRVGAEIQLQTHGELGRISNVGPRRAFPMRGLVARDFAKNRILLIGESAMSFRPSGPRASTCPCDAAQAAELIALEDDPGHDSTLVQYDRLRRRDVQPRQQAIDIMNRSLLSGFFLLEGGRALSLSAIAAFGPLRRYVMAQGLAPAITVPRVMRAQGKMPALMK